MKLLYLLLLWASCSCEAFKILVVFPYTGKSVIMLGHAYVRILLDAGHEVTYITPKPLEPRRNLIQVQVRNDTVPDFINIKLILEKKLSSLDLRSRYVGLANHVVMETFKHKDVQNLMNDQSQKFDLVIALWLHTELLSGFSVVFNCPFVWAGISHLHPFMMSLIDEAPNPTTMTDISSKYIPPLTFFQHLKELLIQLKTHIARKYFDQQIQIYEDFLRPIVKKRGKELPSFEQVKFNGSLFFLPTHYSIGQAPLLPQNVKLIGGYHINANDIRPLQGDLNVFMNNSINGAIYFSMGSNMKSRDMPEKVKNNLMKMFSELKQSVVWKLEDDLPNVPKNVYILKWASQLSILAHPNCVLFINNGGLLSMTESIHFGVPTISIPMLLDQFINAKNAVDKGFSKEIAFTDSLAKDLSVAIEEMLNNSRYAERAKELSMIYHDRPTPPHKELVHWVEHVVRTRGAAHLRSPALLVPWYQKVYLDAVIVAVLVILILKKIYHHLIRYFYKQKLVTKKEN